MNWHLAKERIYRRVLVPGITQVPSGQFQLLTYSSSFRDTVLKKKSKHLHNKKVLDAIEINIWRIKIEFEQIYSVRHFCPHVSSFFMVRHCAS